MTSVLLSLLQHPVLNRRGQDSSSTPETVLSATSSKAGMGLWDSCSAFFSDAVAACQASVLFSSHARRAIRNLPLPETTLFFSSVMLLQQYRACCLAYGNHLWRVRIKKITHPPSLSLVFSLSLPVLVYVCVCVCVCVCGCVFVWFYSGLPREPTRQWTDASRSGLAHVSLSTQNPSRGRRRSLAWNSNVVVGSLG